MGALVVSMLTNTDGELVAGLPEVIGLMTAALAAKLTGNHILSLVTGMLTFWLVGWVG